MRIKSVLAAIILIGIAGLLFAFFKITRDGRPAAAGTFGNVHTNDYVGPQSCAECHQEHFDQWQLHSHRKMNLNATDQTVMGDFSAKKTANGKPPATAE